MPDPTTQNHWAAKHLSVWDNLLWAVLLKTQFPSSPTDPNLENQLWVASSPQSSDICSLAKEKQLQPWALKGCYQIVTALEREKVPNPCPSFEALHRESRIWSVKSSGELIYLERQPTHFNGAVLCISLPSCTGLSLYELIQNTWPNECLSHHLSGNCSSEWMRFQWKCLLFSSCLSKRWGPVCIAFNSKVTFFSFENTF